MYISLGLLLLSFFFFNDTATTEIYTLSLHDALPICVDLALGERQTGRDAVDDGDQGLTVGFASGEEPERASHYFFGCWPGGAWARSSFSTYGVMKTTSSRFGSVNVDFVRKRNPRTGMSPKNGTFRVLSTD